VRIRQENRAKGWAIRRKISFTELYADNHLSPSGINEYNGFSLTASRSRLGGGVAMGPYVRMIFVCGLVLACAQRSQAQLTPNRNGPTVGRSSNANGPEGPKPGTIINEPYSAITETEHSQTLIDGTHIETKTAPEEKTFRDSQGRTRRERYHSASLGGDSTSSLQDVHISDPVGGVAFLLNPAAHLACQMPPYSGIQFTGLAGKCTTAVGPSGEGQLGKVRIVNGLNASETRERPRSNAVTEDLGTQQMEGLTVYGTKTTLTIPAGAQGNDRPMEIVSERWFSPELNIFVLIKNHDPRSGETTIRTTNIERSEPDPALFRVPADYTLMQR
jgi:hypothetical protein